MWGVFNPERKSTKLVCSVNYKYVMFTYYIPNMKADI